MFRRRIRPSAIGRMVNALWPSIGWRRWALYLRHRLARLNGTPHAIAAGFAFGAAVSFTPFVGFHFLIAASVAYLCRASVVSAVIGTAIGNPWSFPLIWLGTFELGHWLMGVPHDSMVIASGISWDFWTMLMSDPLHILLPMCLGSLPIMLLVWPLTYFPLKGAVSRYQIARRRHRSKRLRRRDAVTGAAAVPSSPRSGEGGAS